MGDRAIVRPVVVDPDLALLEAWRAGDKQAVKTLFDRHYRGIRRTLEGKLPPHEVDDAVQRVFVALLEGREAFRAESTFKTYAMRIARILIADHFRSRSRSRTSPADMRELSVRDDGAGPSTMLREKRSQRLLLEALRALDPEEQLLLELHYWEKMTGPQLADVFSCTESTIRHRLRRAKGLLHDQVQTIVNEHRELADTLTNLDEWARSLRIALQEQYRRLPPR